MTPISNGTRLRTDHNTFAQVITSYNAGQKIVGDEVWQASADGNEVKAGDMWLHVTHVDDVALVEAKKGWMAYIHKSQPICKDFQEVTDPDPNPTPVFPESFVLTDPSGKQALYEFARVIE